MKENFQRVKEYLTEMHMTIIKEDAENEMLVVDHESEGVKNMIIDCDASVVIIEQLIMKVKTESAAFYKRLLQMNRELVHGAFVLDETGQMLLFRDTLELENLDYNELESSIKALSLAMSEYGAEMLKFAGA